MPSLLLRQCGTITARKLILATCLLGLVGCNRSSQAEAESRPQTGQSDAQPAAVNVAIARTGTVSQAREYTGTTQPIRLVSLRSQIDGQLLNLNVDIGDQVRQGQVLAQVDGSVLTTNVAEAEAELAALNSEVAQARSAVSDAQTQVNRTGAELRQAQSDLQRLQYLFREGVIPAQQVEQARTLVSTSQSTLRSAQEQVRTRQQEVAAAQKRVFAQQAVVAREQQLQSYTELTSPVTGAVVARSTEPGNLLQSGTEVLQLGDFSRVKVVVQISELELANIRVGQALPMRLDAFPNETWSGRVLRISPAADPVARLVPIEVAIANPKGQIGSGLLARVSLVQKSNLPRVLIPETALEINANRNRQQQNQPQASAGPRDVGTIFVLTGVDSAAKVAARAVTLGKRADGQVEVIAGLEAGDRFVTRSSRALKTGEPVRLSILSDPS